ncbi:hypothetical protein [Spiroplasma taiwanense]|uniref:Uncharacterized protein n=1 Tax=Spiroplasma taiwanense CT-1 TaxID=1276220 RepID=S5LZC8_9MOLU|nr:hypothetical protein [Spiroplasma taiwanense]AGR41062.1 hypothetical protein STAIW_v1c04120 [Spiroplasma taiwanense CT-1]
MKEKINSSIDKEKYGILINGNNFFSGIDLNWSTLEINYSNDNLENQKAGENFISYVKVDLNLQFKYKDENQEEKNLDINQNFVYILTSNQALIDAIKDLEKNVSRSFFLSGSEFSFLDKEDFQIDLNET